MANSDISFSTTSLAALERQILKTAKVLDELRRKLILSMPAKYGSDLWWEKANLEAEEDIRCGRISSFRNANELVKYLHQKTESR